MKDVVKCAVIYDGKFLIIERSEQDEHGGFWETPGGGVDEGEDFLAACIREVFEETGISILNPEFNKSVVLRDDSTKELFNVMLFTAFVDNDFVDIDNNDDHSAYIWIDKSEMDMYNIDSWTLHQLAQTKF